MNYVLVAALPELKGTPANGNPLHSFRGVVFPGDFVAMSRLEPAVTIDGVETGLTRLSPLLEGETEEDGPWLYTVPQHVVEALARLTDSQVGPVALRWAEMLMPDPPPAPFGELVPLLREVNDLARAAVAAPGSKMVVWVQ